MRAINPRFYNLIAVLLPADKDIPVLLSAVFFQVLEIYIHEFNIHRKNVSQEVWGRRRNYTKRNGICFVIVIDTKKVSFRFLDNIEVF